jgi:hypothetical protein
MNVRHFNAGAVRALALNYEFVDSIATLINMIWLPHNVNYRTHCIFLYDKCVQMPAFTGIAPPARNSVRPFFNDHLLGRQTVMMMIIGDD